MINQENLIKDNYYTSTSEQNLKFIWKCNENGQYILSFRLCVSEITSTFSNNISNHNWKYNIKNSTPEEIHWLNCCILKCTEVSFEEAMKTFIPEYVEAISNRHSNSEVIGTIYKTSEFPKWVVGHKLEKYWKEYMFHYKPSTKEAYDAQFVVKQLETPKDKVLKSCHITNIPTEVQSLEGAIYKLGDKITVFTKDSPNKGKVFTIKGFRWNNAKTNICAITELHTPNDIGLDKIELYREDKFILPEKWCILRNLDNYLIINQWFTNNQTQSWVFDNNSGYLYSAVLTENWIRSNDKKKEGHVEITFEQFKEHVLKEIIKNNKS